MSTWHMNLLKAECERPIFFKMIFMHLANSDQILHAKQSGHIFVLRGSFMTLKPQDGANTPKTFGIPHMYANIT